MHYLSFSMVHEEAGPDGRDIVYEREVQSPYRETLENLATTLTAAGYVCLIRETSIYARHNRAAGGAQ